MQENEEGKLTDTNEDDEKNTFADELSEGYTDIGAEENADNGIDKDSGELNEQSSHDLEKTKGNEEKESNVGESGNSWDENMSKDNEENDTEDDRDDEIISEDESNDSESDEDTASYKGVVKSKKIKRTIAAVVFSIFVFALLVFGYFVFFNKSVNGAWKVEDTTSDVTSVLILDKDGSAKFTNGSFTASGEYHITGSDKMNLNIKSDGEDIFNGTYTYRVSAGLTNRTLDLISSSNKIRKCTQYDFKEIVPKVKDFKSKPELLGKWADGRFGYTYEFKDDGNAILSKGNTSLKLTYFVDDTSIKLMQYFIKETPDNDTAMDKLSYTLNGDSLTIGGLTFTRV